MVDDMLSKERIRIIPSILIITLFIIYFQRQSLNLDMYWDDYGVIKSYTIKELVWVFHTDLADSYYPFWVHAWRPIIPLVYHVAYKICGFNPYNLHIMIIILQILQTVLAFFFFRLLTQKNSIALASSLLFPLNPNLWLHFTWAAELGAVSGMIPFLLSLISLLSYIKNPKLIKISFHLGFAILAYLTKETYSVLFFLSLLTIIFYKKDGYKKYLPLVGLHFLIFISYIKVRFSILGGWGAGC